jgi:sugar lactone lactonase YvrE
MVKRVLERTMPGAGKLVTLLAVAAVSVAAVLVAGGPAVAKAFPESVPLPVDFGPEGIAVGTGSTFYVGSIPTGDIYRGDLRTGTGSIFIDAATGRQAIGLKVDEAHHLLFVAGGATGAAYVYDTRSGASVAEFQFATAGASLVNDVIVTRDAAYFTDSFAPVLYKIPIGRHGTLGPGATIPLTGPAATIVPASPNLNGIVATADGRRLIVNHSALGALFTVDPSTGASATIDVSGLIPGTLDGLLLDGKSLWVVENFANLLVRVTLSHDLSSGEITSTITSPLFRVPTTVARHGDTLALVNGRFDVGLPPPFGPGPPPGTDFDVVLVSKH